MTSSNVDSFISDLEALITEAGLKGAPKDPNIADKLSHMSGEADQQTDHAQHLGTPSALKMATQAHAKVAQAAQVQGWNALSKAHTQKLQTLAKATQQARPDRAKQKDSAKIKGDPINPAPHGSAVAQALRKKHKAPKDVANVPVAPGRSPDAPAR